MLKTCFILVVLFSVCSRVFLVDSNEREVRSIENDRNAEVKKEIKKLEDIEAKLDKLRSLLKDPLDEEHDILDNETDDTHAHEWTVQLNSDKYDDAKDIAKQYGFDHIHKLDVGYGVYRFSHSKKSLEEAEKKKKEMIKEKQEEIEVEKTISKRDHIDSARLLANDEKVTWMKRERILQREKRVPLRDAKKEAEAAKDMIPNDPYFSAQWYIRNDGQTTGPAGFDSKIESAWKRGYTGKDVVLSVLDDGMDHTHPELKDNYDPKASTDLNGHKADPFPNDSDPYNAHGTKCSGTIAAKGNNSLCGIGIAYDSKIGAIRMLDGKATDALEANALSFKRDHIDIYSCSWGPKDNGATFGRPGRLGKIALHQGAKFGRNGKGSLFIWATGNGGMQRDDCNADGYVNSIYTLGIGAVNEHGVSTYYGERCAAMFAVTYCSGKHKAGLGDPKANVITTYLHHQCTDHFVGTSSAAPLAAGIFALALEANSNITWRDLQHLVFQTAQKVSPNDLGWFKNGVGKFYNHKFGFGVLDAEKLVDAALNWTTVPKQKSCHFILRFKNGNIPSKEHFKLAFNTDGCQACKVKESDGTCKNAITKLEHAVVNVTLKHRRRGDLSIKLISPSGTVSNLLHQRPFDGSSAGLKGWTFMTVYNWGENPKGTWNLIFTDNKGMNPFDTKDRRDVEEEYMEELDKKKEREQRQQQRNVAADTQRQDENVVTAQGDIYKREDEVSNDAYAKLYDKYRRDESAYEQLKRELYERQSQGYADDYYRSGRKRRSNFADDTTDYVKYKKDTISDLKYEYENDILKRSDLAGEVLDLRITLYGTGE